MVAVAARLELHADTEPNSARHLAAATASHQGATEAVDRCPVAVASPAAHWRGRLAAFVDLCIEETLAQHAAPGREAAVLLDRDEQLHDQLYRARLLGYRGLELWLDDLDALAQPCFDAADSETLRWLLDEAHADSIELLLSPGVSALHAYPAPVPLWQLQPPAAQPLSAEPARSEVPEAPRADALERGEDANAFARGEYSSEHSEDALEHGEDALEHGEDALEHASARDLEVPDSAVVNSMAAPDDPDLADCEAEGEPPHVVAWSESLSGANGAQSWEALERLFVGSYLPLGHVLQERAVSAPVLESVETWAASFQDCYRAAFTRLRSGGPRPAMVLDVPQLAFQAARQLEAARVKLVLVDGMRFDLGQRVHDKLRLQLSGLARCVERRVLWAALPATTATQLELLARGACALGRTLGTLDERAWIAKGAEARKLRSLRVGPHQLSKLDILEAEFARAAWSKADLERAASEVAVSVGRFVKQQPQGTLVIVFSDHGMPADGVARGCLPEEVLVPYDAWLVQGVSAFGHSSDRER